MEATETIAPDLQPPPDLPDYMSPAAAELGVPNTGGEFEQQPEYNGEWKESHAEAKSAAIELARWRREHGRQSAIDDQRDADVFGDDPGRIDPVQYGERDGPKRLLGDREAPRFEEGVTAHEAARNLADYRAQKAQELLQQVAPQEEQAEAEAAQVAAQQELERQQQLASQIETATAEQQESFRQAVEQQVSQRAAQADAVREQYETALTAMAMNAVGVAKSEFDDLKTWEDVHQLAQTNPARFQRFQQVAGHLQAVGQELNRLQQAQQQQRQYAEAQQRLAQAQAFVNYVKQEEAKVAELIPELREGADPHVARELKEASLETLRSAGFGDEELQSGWNDGGVFSLRDARVQQVIADAARYRMAQARAKEAAKKPVPMVQRPGVSVVRSSGAEYELAQLGKRLSETGSLKDAAAFRLAQLRSRR